MYSVIKLGLKRLRIRYEIDVSLISYWATEIFAMLEINFKALK